MEPGTEQRTFDVRYRVKVRLGRSIAAVRSYLEVCRSGRSSHERGLEESDGTGPPAKLSDARELYG